jgi:hypothetical protein
MSGERLRRVPHRGIEEIRIYRDEMLRLFEAHREAEAARDYDAILATLTEDCFFETVPLGLRSEGRHATRAAYEGFFTAFPDVSPDDQGRAIGDDVVVVWGTLRGTNDGDWLRVPRGGGSFAVPFVNVRALQGRLDGRRDDLLRPRHPLRAGGARRRPGSGGCQGQGSERLGTAATG